MPATIQITQGAIVGDPGRSVLGLVVGDDVTLTDDGGSGADSWLWEIVSWPSPGIAPPVLQTPTAQTATVQAPEYDGIYIVKLTRTEGAVVTTDTKFFGCEDADGLHLPSAGMTRAMANVTDEAIPFGWAGSNAGSSNVLLDAFLRKRRLREGKYVGATEVNTYTSGGTGGRNLFYGLAAPNFEVTLASGSGIYTVYLNSSGLYEEEGAIFRVLVTVENGATGFRLDVDGTAVLAAPLPVGLQTSLTTEFLCRFTQGAWTATSRLVSPVLYPKKDLSATVQLIAGRYVASSTVWQTIGAVVLTPEEHPVGQVRFKAVLSSGGSGARLRLVQSLTGTPITNSELLVTSTTPEEVEAILPIGSLNDEILQTSTAYDVQLRSGLLGEDAICTWAVIEYVWGEDVVVGSSPNPACPADSYVATEIDLSGVVSPGDSVTVPGEITGSSPPAIARIAEDGPGYKCNYFYFTVAPGREGTYRIDQKGSVYGEFLDTYLYLKGGPCSYDTVLDSDDDGGTATDSRITAVLTAGTYSIECSAFDTFADGGEGRFDVVITYEPVAPPPPPV